jgi:20S proteasome alpha/beta subunit
VVFVYGRIGRFIIPVVEKTITDKPINRSNAQAIFKINDSIIGTYVGLPR